MRFTQRQVGAGLIASEDQWSRWLPESLKALNIECGRRKRCILNVAERCRIVSNDMSTLPSVTWCADNNSDMKREKEYRSHTMVSIIE